jgi:hypothetical protein
MCAPKSDWTQYIFLMGEVLGITSKSEMHGVRRSAAEEEEA